VQQNCETLWSRAFWLKRCYLGEANEEQSVLVWLFGPPAVGKMTVGLELSRVTGIPLFHNHVSIEAVLPVFEFGTPQFNRLVASFRDQMFTEAAASDLPGLIFTMMWAFDIPNDLRFVEKQKAVFESEGGRAVFVELHAGLETRIVRNETDLRLSSKPSKRDVVASRERLVAADSRCQLDSKGSFPFADYLRIDNTDLAPDDVAEQIVDRFQLARAQSARE
jgi:hypothetical protein